MAAVRYDNNISQVVNLCVEHNLKVALFMV